MCRQGDVQAGLVQPAVHRGEELPAEDVSTAARRREEIGSAAAIRDTCQEIFILLSKFALATRNSLTSCEEMTSHPLNKFQSLVRVFYKLHSTGMNPSSASSDKNSGAARSSLLPVSPNKSKGAQLSSENASTPPVSPGQWRKGWNGSHPSNSITLSADNLSDLFQNVLKSPPLTSVPSDNGIQNSRSPPCLSPRMSHIGLLNGPEDIHPNALFQEKALSPIQQPRRSKFTEKTIPSTENFVLKKNESMHESLYASLDNMCSPNARREEQAPPNAEKQAVAKEVLSADLPGLGVHVEEVVYADSTGRVMIFLGNDLGISFNEGLSSPTKPLLFPLRKSVSPDEASRRLAMVLTKAQEIFGDREHLDEMEFLPISKDICNLPRYANIALFRKVEAEGTQIDLVGYEEFARTWTDISRECHDEEAILFKLLQKNDAHVLTPDDFLPILEDVVLYHPGLDFLADNPLFQERYAETVICRIFYNSKNFVGRMTLGQFRRSDFVNELRRLEETCDLSTTRDCFSYKHFYVIYCKFFELDTDHDLVLHEEDLARYGNYALTTRILKRVLNGCAKLHEPFRKQSEGGVDEELYMGYLDFIWFFLSETDKSTPTAIEYWFRCMDLDDDGVLTVFELEYFFQEQVQRMEIFEAEIVKLEDCICQIMDLVNPVRQGQISLADLKRCKQAPEFFDLFFNLSRCIAYEHYHHHLRVRKQLLRAECNGGGSEEGENEEEWGVIEEVDDMSEWEIYAEIEYRNMFTAKQLQRQSKKCNKDELTEKAKLKKAIQQGNNEGARIYAANAIRKKNEALNLLRLSSRIDAVASRVQTAVTMRKVTSSMANVVKGMDKAMESMNLEKISLVMDKFEAQFEDLDVQTGYMEGAMGSSTTLTTPQEEVDVLMQQVADEAGLELNQELRSAATSNVVPQLEKEEKESDELAERLKQLRQ
ncbi:uncharacterized protein VTP21DRAFT_4648 [Calcarisporiella thermophila]|uniref:uncharacterized protein n=1 Tax=Calcarisporiella thermophila TaxID=911321 RepID=UPI00374319E6